MIKKFQVEDIDEVMDIWLQTNIAAHPFIEAKRWEGLFDVVKNQLPHADLFEYREDDTIKGFVGVVDKGYIAGLFVKCEYQSQGIGGELLDFCKARYTSLGLDVFIENRKAIHFYKNNGFDIVKEKMNPDFQHKEFHMVWKK